MEFEGEGARFFTIGDARNNDTKNDDKNEGGETTKDDFESSGSKEFGRSGLAAGDSSGGDLIKILLFVHLFYYSTIPCDIL